MKSRTTTTVRAPIPGEFEWIQWKIGQVRGAELLPQNIEEVGEALREIRDNEGWRDWPIDPADNDSRNFSSWEEFITSYQGLFMDIPTAVKLMRGGVSDLEALVLAGTPPAKAVGRPRNDSGKGKERVPHFTGGAPDTVARTVARLKRDHPDLAEEVIAKERSAASARREAGFAPKSVRVSLHENPWTAAKALVKHLGRERAQALAARVLDVLEDEGI